MRKYLGILTLALGTATVWAQEISTAPAHVNLLLQTNFAAQEETPVAFSIKRAEVTLSGHASRSLGYLVRLDPTLPIPPNNRMIKDGIVSWDACPALGVSAGRFKFPQGLEGRTLAGSLLFIERSVLGRTFGDVREYGAQAAGRAGILEYAGAAINDRSAAVRAGIGRGPFFVGATGLYGEPSTGLRKRWGLEGRVQASSWTWQGEAGFGEDNGLEQGGAYATLARRIGCLRPAVRVEEWDPNRNTPNDKEWWVTAGADWFVLGDERHGSKVTVNGALGLEEGPAKSNNALLVQWQVVW